MKSRRTQHMVFSLAPIRGWMLYTEQWAYPEHRRRASTAPRTTRVSAAIAAAVPLVACVLILVAIS